MDEHDPRDDWKSRLWQLMKERGLKKADIARIAGVTPAAVSQWFKEGDESTSSLSAVSLMNLCKELNIREKWLWFGEGPRDSGTELTPEIAAAINLLRLPPGRRPPPLADPSD